MPDIPRPNAAVFRRSERDFMLAAGDVRYTDPSSGSQLNYYLSVHAPALNSYFAHYLHEVVEPFNRDDAGKGVIFPHGRRNIHAFAAGGVMTYKMINGVHLNTGAELPAASGIVPEPLTHGFNYDGEKPVIDIYYRGAEFRDRLPHVYPSVLDLMAKVLDAPVDELDIDLASPVRYHPDIHRAFQELHFIGGAAEIALTIEDAAPDAE